MDLSSNNPAGEPPSADSTSAAPNIDQEIFDTLGLSSTPADADSIANKGPNSQPGVASPPAVEGAGSTAQPAPEPSPAAPTPPPPAAPEPAPAQPSAEPPAPSATPAAPPAASLAVDEEALRRASLEAQVNALSAEVERLRANPQPVQPQPGQPAPAAEPGQPAAEQLLRYNLTLPEATRAALLSDDPQQNLSAINAIVNDLGTIVHNSVVGQMRKEFSGAIQNLLSEAARVEQGSVRDNAAEGARAEYYKAFPSHNNPLVLPLIQAESQKMAAEFPHLAWGEQYINALGARVNGSMEALTAARTGQPPEPTPPNGNPPPARPAAMLPAGNREPSAVTPGGDLSEEIVGVLNPF